MRQRKDPPLQLLGIHEDLRTARELGKQASVILDEMLYRTAVSRAKLAILLPEEQRDEPSFENAEMHQSTPQLREPEAASSAEQPGAQAQATETTQSDDTKVTR